MVNEKCSALGYVDSHFENEVVCHLSKGHEGDHESLIVVTDLAGTKTVNMVVTWATDMREPCCVCGKITANDGMCENCNAYVCDDCYEQYKSEYEYEIEGVMGGMKVVIDNLFQCPKWSLELSGEEIES